MTRKHLLLMAICCTVPIMGLAAIFLFQIQISTVLLLGLILLCPALHLWMMRGHTRHSAHIPEQTDSPASSDKANGHNPLGARE
jgi:Protein of unknown function (DUF2933)